MLSRKRFVSIILLYVVDLWIISITMTSHIVHVNTLNIRFTWTFKKTCWCVLELKNLFLKYHSRVRVATIGIGGKYTPQGSFLGSQLTAVTVWNFMKSIAYDGGSVPEFSTKQPYSRIQMKGTYQHSTYQYRFFQKSTPIRAEGSVSLVNTWGIED